MVGPTNCFIFLMILNWWNFYMCFYFAPLILEILVPAVQQSFVCQKNIICCIWCKDINFLNLFSHCDYGHNYLRTDACFLLQEKKEKKDWRMFLVLLAAGGPNYLPSTTWTDWMWCAYFFPDLYSSYNGGLHCWVEFWMHMMFGLSQT